MFCKLPPSETFGIESLLARQPGSPVLEKLPLPPLPDDIHGCLSGVVLSTTVAIRESSHRVEAEDQKAF